jgi:hypothetical protein
MKNIKVRKVGNSIGIILRKESGLQVGDLLGYKQDGKKLILDAQNVDKEHDKRLIESSFEDFSNGNILLEEDLKNKFGKYGWGSGNV